MDDLKNIVKQRLMFESVLRHHYDPETLAYEINKSGSNYLPEEIEPLITEIRKQRPS